MISGSARLPGCICGREDGQFQLRGFFRATTFPEETHMDRVNDFDVLKADVNLYRSKAEYYRSRHLFETARYADKLADNLELALTTLPSGKDTVVS